MFKNSSFVDHSSDELIDRRGTCYSEYFLIVHFDQHNSERDFGGRESVNDPDGESNEGARAHESRTDKQEVQRSVSCKKRPFME